MSWEVVLKISYISLDHLVLFQNKALLDIYSSDIFPKEPLIFEALYAFVQVCYLPLVLSVGYSTDLNWKIDFLYGNLDCLVPFGHGSLICSFLYFFFIPFLIIFHGL